MAITQTRTFTRPSSKIPFWVLNQLTRDYIADKYISTGKILDLRRVEDAGGSLTISLVTVFLDEAARDEFVNDTVIVEVTNQRTQHNLHYNIVEELTVEG